MLAAARWPRLPPMSSPTRSGSRAVVDDVWHEARRVAGHRRRVLADADAADLAGDHPRADHWKPAGEIRRRRAGLDDVALGAVRTRVRGGRAADPDADALTAEQRLAHGVGTQRRGARIVLEIGRQQRRMIG